jgi:hypothetical protein
MILAQIVLPPLPLALVAGAFLVGAVVGAVMMWRGKEKKGEKDDE